MIQLTLPVFMIREDIIDLLELDNKVEISESDCELRDHTFYNIDLIYPTSDNHCIIVSGGNEYQVKEKYEVVKELVKQQLTFKFN